MPRLKLISSPVVKSDGFTLTSSTERDEQAERKPHLSPENSYNRVGGQQEIKDPLPQFVQHEESTTIELFYDLFFVANLTTFSDVHEVNSRKTLTSYMGFFCILWFTWCQTSLYDIRFVADSWAERAAKACHLGVMVSLAVVGPNYDTEVKKNTEGLDEHSSVSVLKTMALILMISRLVLCFQYLSILFQVRSFRHTKLPLGLITGANFAAAIVYLIIGLAFEKHEHAYRAFYVVAVIEMMANIAISSSWKVLSFKRTHLVERMSLLTLYILGEGVIDILKSVGRIVEVRSKWSSGTIGLVVASIASIYMLYMLYFDCLNHKHFGSIRQQIWAFAHFPFHVALVLSLAGMAQLEKWYQVVLVGNPFIIEYETKLVELIPEIFGPDANNTLVERSNQTFTDIAESLSGAAAVIFDKYTPDYPQQLQWQNDTLTIKAGYDLNEPETAKIWAGAIADLLQTVLNSVFSTYGFEPPEIDESSVEENPLAQIDADFDAIAIVFKYFFIAGGMTFVILGFMSLIMDTHKRWSFGTIIRFISHFVVGLALALLAIMKSNQGEGAGFDFATTPWVIPTYTIAIALVLGFHHIKWGSRDQEVEEIDHMTERTG